MGSIVSEVESCYDEEGGLEVGVEVGSSHGRCVRKYTKGGVDVIIDYSVR